jgi:DNA invertase Pin-like site-specific DNA recombinase
MKPSPRVGLYFRVSSRDQSFASQEMVVRDYCARQGWKNLTAFREKISGLKATLPVLAKLLQAVRDGSIDRIVVFKLDRIGRSPIQVWQILLELKKRKIPLISVTENFDTSETNPMAEAMHQTMSVFAGLFSAQLSDRVRAGQAAAKRRGGKAAGRPWTAPETIEKIRTLLNKKGAKVREVAQQAGVSLPIVYRVKKEMEEKK